MAQSPKDQWHYAMITIADWLHLFHGDVWYDGGKNWTSLNHAVGDVLRNSLTASDPISGNPLSVTALSQK